MNRRTTLGLLLGIAFLSLSTCPSPATPVAANQTFKLPSGREAKILSVSKFEYSKGVMALMVRYQTTLTVDEAKALSQEVDDVWKLVQKQADSERYQDAIISSNEVPKGIFITANHVLNFIYEKGADGKWTRLNGSDSMALQ